MWGYLISCKRYPSIECAQRAFEVLSFLFCYTFTEIDGN